MSQLYLALGFLQAAFRAEGVDAHAVDGRTSDLRRSNLLEGFKMGDIPVLINCGVFTEGTDIPCVDSIIFAR